MTHLETKIKIKFFRFNNNESEENKINKNINKIVWDYNWFWENYNDIILRHNIKKKMKLTKTNNKIYSNDNYELINKEKVKKEKN